MTTDVTTGERERLLDEWAAAWSANDAARFLALFADTVEYEDVPSGLVHHGRDELRTFYETTFACAPDFACVLTAKVVAGHQAAVEVTWSGTDQGGLPGMPPTGKHFTFRGATVMEFQDGKITRNVDYWDLAGLLRQLGLFPKPA